MGNAESLQFFEDQPIRTAWDGEAEEWFFSIVDVVGVLTEQPDARHASTYWAVLKKRLNEEGASELLTNCKQLKMKAADGKRRSTDVANTEQLLRMMLTGKLSTSQRPWGKICKDHLFSRSHSTSCSAHFSALAEAK